MEGKFMLAKMKHVNWHGGKMLWISQIPPAKPVA
jgi:hypothetical protein